ncbi:hypothetical protein [Streptomyces coeruleorubidus]|uniref:Uncharacterized protein n=1 Tax=Streptomyces coeruleorubidus TaxID=116188 RepID=A0A5J6HVW4_STRC4|nr:hypothetical protein [Streptomyces coeruleorubidus]QEV23978.1 hypothetical protein CP976_07340 [Streptomyces coeruleorubidus]GGT85654.1 hypothetical protein GCM10010256_52210 [Streptomyces coeruleorubidus]
MATQIVPAPVSAEHTPVAPLSPAAAEALAKLERAFLPVSLVRAVTRYEIAVEYRDRLSERRATTWTAAEFGSFFDCGPIFEESLRALEAAGRLDLIAPARIASRYRRAASTCRSLAASADFDGCLAAQDEMAMCRCQLADAGRLDLIEAAS